VKLSTEIEHTFTSVNKDEYNHVKAYLERKNVRVKEIGEDNTMRTLDAMDLGSDEDEDDADSGDDRRKKSAPKDRRAAGADDDDESGRYCFSVRAETQRLTNGFHDTIEEDADFASDSAPSSPSDTDDSGAESDGAMSDVTDDMVVEAKNKAKKKAAKGDAPKKKKKAADAPAVPAKSKPAEKSKETIDDSDDDVMAVDAADVEPKKKKQKTA
jgi:structure-specific recognition protein 1